MTAMNRCRSCGAYIIWLRTSNGGWQPFDAIAIDDGNRVIENGVAVAYQPLLHSGQPRYVAHHATCPHGQEWKR